MCTVLAFCVGTAQWKTISLKLIDIVSYYIVLLIILFKVVEKYLLLHFSLFGQSVYPAEEVKLVIAFNTVNEKTCQNRNLQLSYNKRVCNNEVFQNFSTECT